MRTSLCWVVAVVFGVSVTSCTGDDDESRGAAGSSAASTEPDVKATKPETTKSSTATRSSTASTSTAAPTTTVAPPPVVEPVPIELPEDLGSAGAVALVPAQAGRGHLLIGYAQDERRPTQPRIWESADGVNWSEAPAPTPPDDQTLLTVTGASWLGGVLAVGGSTAPGNRATGGRLVRHRRSQLRRPA